MKMIRKMNYKIIGKYIKDLKFEIPTPNIYFQLGKNISNYKINIDIKSNQIKEKIVEVEISLFLKPVKKEFEEINVKVKYSVVIELEKIISDKKELEQIILIKVPNETYKDIRKIFVSIFEASGFKDIKIDQAVDFQKLYNSRRN